MGISLELIDRLALWSKLTLDQDEKLLLVKEFDKILGELDIIKESELHELELDDMDIKMDGFTMEGTLREDKVCPSMDRDAILENAPDTRENMFVIPSALD